MYRITKMDKLRGQDESAFPEWKEALSKTLHELRLFANEINEDISIMRKRRKRRRIKNHKSKLYKRILL